MPTFRKICSDILNDFRASNLDDRISYRFIINKLKSSASVFLKQDAEARKVFKINSIWRSLDCIELEPSPLIDCAFDIGGGQTIQKSKKQLPETYQTSYGNVIKILNQNYTKEYTEIRPQDYKNYKHRRFNSPNIGYFWIEDNYLYIIGSEVESVRGLGIFKDTIKVDLFNCVKGAECFSPLDSEFLFPDYLIEISKQEIIKSIASVTKRVVVDENSNLNSNIK